jgi:cytochrome c oxidase subunit 1
MTAAGGTLMFISMALFFLILIMTIAAGRKTVVADIPLTETVTAPAVSGWRLNLDYFHYWVLAAVVLAVAVYGPFLVTHLPPDLAATGLQYP